jgi:two-component system response regulator AtoC
MIEKVLLVDDEPIMLRFIAEILQRQGKEVSFAENGALAIEKLKTESFDLIITDMCMPNKTGLDVMIAAKELQPQCLVIIATAHGSVESAVDAVKLGAFNYLLKPFSLEALELALQKGEEHVRLLKENRFLREEHGKTKYPHFIAESPQMKKILFDLEKIAKSNASVFITGESGTGKEVIGSAIHQLSSRGPAPFIKVNCAAIPETLIESEFFGHERGAFTGALQRKTGRFELADKGTLLLDEVTEIPLTVQAKLLRAIQEQEFERVGGMRPIKVNIRFLATSNRNMHEAIESKIFREDLFYRLNVIPLHIPPLRERPEDILPLAYSFLAHFCKENHKPSKQFSESAIQKLLTYPWPGNVRELKNIIERIVVLDFDTKIDVEHLYLDVPPTSKITPGKGVLPIGISLQELERRFILDTLDAHHRNKTKTAAALKISVRTLRNKLHEYETIIEE